jgi:hypothetical protein
MIVLYATPGLLGTFSTLVTQKSDILCITSWIVSKFVLIGFYRYV